MNITYSILVTFFVIIALGCRTQHPKEITETNLESAELAMHINQLALEDYLHRYDFSNINDFIKRSYVKYLIENEENINMQELDDLYTDYYGVKYKIRFFIDNNRVYIEVVDSKNHKVSRYVGSSSVIDSCKIFIK